MKVLRAAVVLGISTPLVVLACGSDDKTKAPDRMGAGGEGGEPAGGGNAGKTNNGGSNSISGKGGGGSTSVAGADEGGSGGADVVEMGGAGGADIVGETGGAGGETNPPEPVCGDADVAGGLVCFKDPAPLSLVAGVPADLAIGDWDGAGGLDVIVASELGVTYFKNEGTGPGTENSITGLVNNTAVLGAGQLDSQTKLDLLLAAPNSGTSTVIFGDGAGQVGKTETNSFNSEGILYNYFVADIAGSSSSQDLVVTFNSSVNLVQTTGTEGEGFVSGTPQVVWVAASDGVMAKLGSSQWLIYSNAEGIHRKLMTYDAGSVTLGQTTLDTPAGGAPAQLDVGDFNEDGFGDVVATLTDKGAVSVLFGDGVGAGDFAKVGATDQFLSLTIGATADAKTARDVKVGDFNGDGHADVAVSAEALNAVAIFSGDGEGGFSEPKLVPTGDASAPTRLAVGDLNDDGVDDLAVVGTVAASKKIIILLSDP